jgi:hypothetical protein
MILQIILCVSKTGESLIFSSSEARPSKSEIDVKRKLPIPQFLIIVMLENRL